jgi:hypothetical protein
MMLSERNAQEQLATFFSLNQSSPQRGAELGRQVYEAVRATSTSGVEYDLIILDMQLNE